MAGAVDTLEVACLWSDEVGTAEAWYRLLNVGVPIALSAGTDAFSNFYRSMAAGTTRVHVRVEGELNLSSYLDGLRAGLRAGRSFVTSPELAVQSPRREADIVKSIDHHGLASRVHDPALGRGARRPTQPRSAGPEWHSSLCFQISRLRYFPATPSPDFTPCRH